MESGYLIREVSESDAEELLGIYSYYVLNTAISFEYSVPSAEEFLGRIRNVTERFPYLVCVKDGAVVGYIYAAPYSTRDAYSWTAASSIYVHKDHRRRGIGTALYGELTERLRGMGIVNLLAGASYCENEDEYLSNESYKFHTKIGFVKAAHFKGIGKKFDRWYDLLWMQKTIGER